MSNAGECLEVGEVKDGGRIVVNNGEQPDYTALINEALKRYEGQVKVVSVTIFKHPCRNKHIGAISFDSSLRNLTSCGPRDDANPDQLINAIEEYDDIRLKNYNWKNEPKIEMPKKNSVLHCLRLTRELYKVLPTTPFRYTIYIRGYKHILKQVVTGCLVGPYEKVTICGRLYGDQILNYDEMDFLLNLIKPEAYFELGSEMIEDFSHEKAFQFKSFFYHHAEWITLDDLKSLRNHNVVRLGSTKFTSKDINEFLKYWSECDEPMMNIFSVHLGHPPTISEMRMRNRREICVPEILLFHLTYFALVEQNYSGAAPLVYYIKAKFKWAKLLIFRTRIEFTTEISLFTHENVKEAIALAEKSGIQGGEIRLDEIQ